MTARTLGVVALAGVLGWLGLIWLATVLYRTSPPTAGFDLELLLKAGRDVAAGRSPYDPSMLAGSAPVAERLFYSYPPLVAQVMALFAAVPSAVMFAAWTVTAVAGYGIVIGRLASRFARNVPPVAAGLVAVALVPLVFPFAIGLLFGNLDVFFPMAYGLVLLAVVGPASGAQAGIAGGAAALAVIGKLQPAPLGLWLVVRAPASATVRRVAVAAIAVGVVALGLSLLVGGVQPWLDYATIVRAGSGADLVDPRNAGPAAQIALLMGGGGAASEALARSLQIPISIGAIVLAIVAAIRVREPVESLAWAVVASLVILPVTWYHYPAALLPFAVVALLRCGADPMVGRRVRGLLVMAAVTAAFAVTWLPLLYVAVGLVLVAIRVSARTAIDLEPVRAIDR